MNYISRDDAGFPRSLLHITDPPDGLYIEGTLPSADEYTYICIIGSRKHTSYGKSACHHIIEGLAGYPIVIVSGLAYGIDYEAHTSALSHNIKTIAFPGSGLDPTVLYPRRHHTLAQKIIKTGGAIISEFEPTTPAGQWTFPRRNRLMAGISDAIIVIEAHEKSGTKITAGYAADYGKELMAVPGSIFSSASRGTATLIKDGALPITSADDVLEILGFHKRESPQTLPLRTMSDTEERILNMCTQPISRSALMRHINIPLHEITALLSQLEIEGYLDEKDGMYMRVG